MGMEGIPKPRAPQSIAEEIEIVIETLPPSLRTQWENRMERATEQDFPGIKESLDAFMQRREQTLRQAPASIGEFRHSEHDPEHLTALRNRIHEASVREDLRVGRGNVAKVFRDPAAKPDLCYKLVDNFVLYEKWNSIGIEARFLEDLEDVSIRGVRTPRVDTVIDAPDMKAIAMEYLHADSVTDLIEHRKPLPPHFDVKEFFDRVRAYVAHMHSLNIYHRDLHGGNILIDRVDGTPYIIDFGQAKFSPSLEDAYRDHELRKERVFTQTDEEHIDALEVLLSKYQRSVISEQ